MLSCRQTKIPWTCSSAQVKSTLLNGKVNKKTLVGLQRFVLFEVTIYVTLRHIFLSLLGKYLKCFHTVLVLSVVQMWHLQSQILCVYSQVFTCLLSWVQYAVCLIFNHVAMLKKKRHLYLRRSWRGILFPSSFSIRNRCFFLKPNGSFLPLGSHSLIKFPDKFNGKE